MPTAVVPVAGSGIRMRPITQVVPKELLPVGRLPVLHHVVSELAAGGIQRIVLVSSPSKPAIEEYLNEVMVPKFTERLGIDCEVIYQGDIGGNGGAVLSAVDHIGAVPMIVVWGDEVFLGPSRTSELLRAWEQTQKPVVSLVEVTDEQVSQCGIALTEATADPYRRVLGIMEKPTAQMTTSRFASVGGYIIADSLFDILRGTKPSQDGEVYLSSALDEFARSGVLFGCELKSRWYETGSPVGYARAFAAMAELEGLI